MGKAKFFKFAVEKNERYGVIGARPVWYPQAEPLWGMAVAHDILEHFPKDDGSAEGEFQATGAGLYVRGETGSFKNSSAEENLSSEILETWSYNVFRDKKTTLRPCPLTRDSDLMETAREIVRLGCREGEERGIVVSLANRELIARWIAKGYRRAKTRYDRLKIAAYSVAYDLFKEIEEQADRCLKGSEEGMVLTVRIDYSEKSVRVDCDYLSEVDY